MPAVSRLLRMTASTLIVLAVSGCASTEVVQLWRDPKYSARPIRRVFIVATGPKDAARVQFENALAQALTAKGFPAATEASVFPPGQLDRWKVKEYVDANQVDLLIMLRVTKEVSTQVTPATVTTYSRGWYGGYGATSYTTAYVSENTNVLCETNVFDVHPDPDVLIWAGKSDTFNMQSAQEAATSLSTALVKDLIQAQILVK